MKNICDKVQGGFYRLKIIYVKQLSVLVPQTIIKLKRKDDSVKLADQLLKLNEEKQQQTLQTRIDQI